MNDASVNLRPVWEGVLAVYREVAKLCDKHGLRYYLTDGTAIGAVRHNGFVPWDDDFDMSMPREDYERFIEIAAYELPRHLKFVNWHNTPGMTLLFGKVHETRRDVVEKIESECGYMLSSGIYIDIIPIDGYPTSRIEQVYVKSMVSILSCIIRFRCMTFSAQSKRGRWVWLAGLVLSVLMPWMGGQRCKSVCEGYLKRHPFVGAKFTGRASLRLTMLNRRPMPIEYWGVASKHQFEGIEVPLPEKYDEFLRFYFGDYMKLPPEEKRHHAHEYNYRCSWWLG